MTSPCSDLLDFIDGELDATRGEAFRAHLVTCPTCPDRLIDALEMTARLDAIADVPVEAHQAAGRPEDLWPVAPRDTTPAPDPAPAIVAIALPRRRRLARWASGSFAAAAATVVVYLATSPPANAFREVASRPYDLRFAYADARGYKPLHGELRGDAPAANDRISNRALAALDDRDAHGAAIAMAWNRDATPEVVNRLRKLASTPAVRNDLTVVQHLTTSPDNLEPALASFEALQRSDDAAVVRAADWNHAVLLERLQLPFSAATAFAAIVQQLEPGWATEALQRTVELRAAGDVAWNAWRRVAQDGERLLRTGEPVTSASLQTAPGMMRAYLYNAARSAPSRARVLALAPMAAALDRQGPPVLSDYIARTATLDFTRRAPLATLYAKLLTRAELTDDEQRALLPSDPSDDVADIVMGAMHERSVIPEHLAWYRGAAQRSGDPWFDVIAAKAAAKLALQHGDWLAAEARLREGEQLCAPALAYQCLDLANDLGHLYEDLHRIPEALAVLRAALAPARSSGELGRYRALLHRLADVEEQSSSPATARAYANELLAMPTTKPYQRSAYLLLAGSATLELDGPAARRALDEVLKLGPPDIATANLLVDISRLAPRPGDIELLRGWLAKLRDDGHLSAGDRVLADETEGRAVIEHDSPAGIALVERAIAEAEANPDDVEMQRARAGGYSVLAFDAARRGDHPRVVTMIARELGLPVPATCAVAMAAEDERAVVVVRGPDGADRAQLSPRRAASERTIEIPEALVRSLASCARVQVLARAALQGQPHVLPRELAWSYVADARGRVAHPRDARIQPRTLVVTDVRPPDFLHLPALAAPPIAPPAVALRGAEATPARVLAEMTDATEIQFHTHARVDAGVSDAAHLVLSPDPRGTYALTAEAIRGSALRGQPVVVLAACHSAQGARYEDVTWSLPDAFLAAGARAVFAVGTAVPDAEAGRFFDDVLRRVRAGAEPAVALRDARMAVPTSATSWVNDVILFE